MIGETNGLLVMASCGRAGEDSLERHLYPSCPQQTPPPSFSPMRHSLSGKFTILLSATLLAGFGVACSSSSGTAQKGNSGGGGRKGGALASGGVNGSATGGSSGAGASNSGGNATGGNGTTTGSSGIGGYSSGGMSSCTGSGGGTTATCSAPASAVDGVCGLSYGVAESSAPTSGLCAAGRPSQVSGSGPWIWTCTGVEGGATASCSACVGPTVITASTAGASSWAAAKAKQAPVNELPGEFTTPYAQPLSTLAWEDGIYISRDGLSLYATYIPMDLLKAVLDSVSPTLFYLYRRGPTLAGQVFPTNISPPNPWLHADVAIAQRSATSVPFTSWCLSNLHMATGYDLGAFQGDLNTAHTGYDRVVYTDDSLAPGGPKIALLQNVGLSPSPTGMALPSPLNTAGTEFDNPHIELVGGVLALFFDSQDLQGVTGGKHVFYSTSVDNGVSWSSPTEATTVNDTTVTKLGGPAQQPHLYNDGSVWWLYFGAANAADFKQAIYRAPQGTPGDWNSWGAPTLVVSAGTTMGVGEPTVTSHGDLSFVAIYQNGSGTAVDTYDADPWYLPHQ